MAQIPPIDDAYINEIIKSNGPYNPQLLTTQGVKLRELIKLLRDRMEQGDTGVVHTTGDESISGTKTFTLLKAEGISVNNLDNPSLNTVISPLDGVQTKYLSLTEGTFGVQLSSSVLAASRSQILPDKDGVVALTSDLAAFATLSQLDTGLDSKIDDSQRGVPGGVSTLDSGGKILASQLPDNISGALTYQGTWDAVTNTPALVNPPESSTKGYYHVTNTAGTQFGITFAVGDWIVSNGTAWEKIDNSDAVTTVFGRLGNVLPIETDYSTFYPLLSGSYANPSWITSLAYSKITGAPDLGLYQLLSEKGVMNGYASLNANAKVPTAQLLEAASSIPGIVSVNTQSFSGQKVFLNGVRVSAGDLILEAVATSLGSYDFLTRNTVTGQTEKIALNTALSGYEQLANKQNSLTVDGTNTKYPTVTAVNTGLATKQNTISLTTTGTSGAATLVGNTLNIPNYAPGGSGTVTSVTSSNANIYVTDETTTPVITLSPALEIEDLVVTTISSDLNLIANKGIAFDNEMSMYYSSGVFALYSFTGGDLLTFGDYSGTPSNRANIFGDLMFFDNTRGVVLRSPGNSVYRIVVSDTGVLSTVPFTGP